MRIIKQSWAIEGLTVPIFDAGDHKLLLDPICENELGNGVLRLIEKSGRTCYKTEGNIDDIEKTKLFVQDKIKKGHLSIIEHVSICIRAITDRGVTHELVRHRIASYSQESTRYCNYAKDKFGNEITVIIPVEFYDIYQNDWEELLKTGKVHPEELWQRFGDGNETLKPLYEQFTIWYKSCSQIETNYLEMIKKGAAAQLARSILMHSLKVEIVVTFNVREWLHFFEMRDHSAAHPQMRQLAHSIHTKFQEYFPELFGN
jgi:thymidylate synthase (FAD)